ncbi:MAG: hypothetical protein BMS9Abin07_1448 [Acidimicrobiia bacterium]|nr:MAG: hypothetical protein BMS9Abin07_1448 [Acidimicrobiia bacterium]
MTAPLIRVRGDFAVARPIPWDERDTLRDHVDRVVDALMLVASVVEVETEATLDEGRVTLAVVLAAVDAQGADVIGRETFAASIRECEGRHYQLLSTEQEANQSPNLPSHSGLLTPLWRLRTLSVEPVLDTDG